MLIEKIRSRVGLLVGLIAVSIVSFLLTDALTTSGRIGARDPNVIGTVNGSELSRQEYERRVQTAEDNYAQNGMDVDESLRHNIREQSWNQYVEEAIAQKAYKDLGIEVTDAELSDLMMGKNLHPSIKSATPFLDENKQFSRTKFEQYIKSFEDENVKDRVDRKARWIKFEEGVIKDQLRKKYVSLVKKAIFTPDWQVKQDHINKNQKAGIQFVLVPYSTVNDADVSITDADLRNYINQNQAQFKQEKSRTVDYISFPINASPKDITDAQNAVISQIAKFKTSSDEERFLKNLYSETPYTGTYYTKQDLLGIVGDSTVRDSLFSMPIGTVVGPYLNEDAYHAAKVVDRKSIADSVKISQIVKFPKAQSQEAIQAAKKLVDSLETVLKNGATFASIAATFSDDASTKEKGGTVEGYINLENSKMDKNVLDSIFYKYKQGDIFAIPGQSAFYIIKIEEARGAKTAVKAAVLSKNIEPSQTTTDSLFARANTFVSDIKSVEDLKAAAQKNNYQIRTSKDLGINAEQIEGLGTASEIITWAYQNKVGTVSPRVFQVDTKMPNGRIKSNYVVASIAHAKEKGIATIDDVREKVTTRVKQEKKAAKIIEKIGNQTDLNQIASATGQTLQVAENITFDGSVPVGSTVEPKVQGAVAGLAKDKISKPIAGNSGVYIVKVSNVSVPESSSVTKEQLQNSARNTVDMGLFKALQKSFEVDDLRNMQRIEQ